MKAARIYVLLSTTLVAFLMRLNTWFDQEYLTIYIILYPKCWILRTLERYARCIVNMRYSSLGHELVGSDDVHKKATSSTCSI